MKATTVTRIKKSLALSGLLALVAGYVGPGPATYSRVGGNYDRMSKVEGADKKTTARLAWELSYKDAVADRNALLGGSDARTVSETELANIGLDAKNAVVQKQIKAAGFELKAI